VGSVPSPAAGRHEKSRSAKAKTRVGGLWFMTRTIPDVAART
jgi:hypothetical protein